MSANISQPQTLQTYRLQMVREAELPYLAPITTPADVAQILTDFLREWDREVFVVLALDSRNRPIGINTASIGTVSASLVHPREVFKFAFLANASAIILGHNHPSGDPSPSGDDIQLTQRLQRAGKLLGIEVLDHLIIAENDFFSIKERGLMD